jgi:DNA-binding MurR/RpiR family transcriptional regulator
LIQFIKNIFDIFRSFPLTKTDFVFNLFPLGANSCPKEIAMGQTRKSEDSILSRLESNFETFTKTQQNIARYVLSHSDEVSFLGVDELSNRCRTTASTVVRFAKDLGYRGYLDLQQDLKDLVLNKIKALGQLERVKFSGLPDKKSAAYLSINNDLANLEKLINSIGEEEINRFVDLVESAEAKFVIAYRSSYSLGHFFWYQVNKILHNIHFINQCSSDPYDVVKDITPNDVLIAFSFPRFTKQTIEFSEFAKKRGVKIACFTDGKTSPMYKLSDACLFSSNDGTVTALTANVAPMAMINAVLAEIFYRHRASAIDRLEAQELILQDKQILVVTGASRKKAAI